MTDPDELGDFIMPAHYADDTELPCFACWLETMLEAAEDVYASDGHQAYVTAVTLALCQVADAVGGLMAVLTPGSAVLRDAFIYRLSSAMALESATAGDGLH